MLHDVSGSRGDPDVIKLVVGGMRPDLAALRGDTPRAVALLMQQCWEQDSSRRPAASDVAQTLDALLHNVTVQSPDLQSPDLRLSSVAVSKMPSSKADEVNISSSHVTVWAAAWAGDVAGLKAALENGGSVNEADEVRWQLPSPLTRLTNAFVVCHSR